ncbi:MAG: site-specific integrase, partial [Ekhidna sp.]|nr:site-specific integrase [Ekhidna sp.]
MYDNERISTLFEKQLWNIIMNQKSLSKVQSSSNDLASAFSGISRAPLEEVKLIGIWLFSKPENTRRTYRSDLSQFYDLFPGISFKDVEAFHVFRFMNQLEENGLKPSSINRALTT